MKSVYETSAKPVIVEIAEGENLTRRNITNISRT